MPRNVSGDDRQSYCSAEDIRDSQEPGALAGRFGVTLTSILFCGMYSMSKCSELEGCSFIEALWYDWMRDKQPRNSLNTNRLQLLTEMLFTGVHWIRNPPIAIWEMAPLERVDSAGSRS